MTDRIVVSYSEIDTFRDCPLKHHLAYVQRWSKEPQPGTPLARGSLMHDVWAIHYQTIREHAAWLVNDGLEFGTKAILELARTRIEESGAFDDSEDGELIQWMYEGYVAHYGVDPQWEIIAVEHKAELPLLTSKEVAARADLAERAKPESVDILEPVRFWVKVIIDLVVRDRRTGKLWIVDHKSAGDLEKDFDLELHDQFGIYTAALRAMGKKVLGSMYNGIRTKKLKGRAMVPDERFRRKSMYRTDIELDNLILDFRRAAEVAYRDDHPPYSSPNPRQCSWKCDYRDAHIAGRKGIPIEAALRDFGFRQNRTRH